MRIERGHRRYGPMPKSQLTALRMANYGYQEAGASTTRRSTKGFTASSGSADRDINDPNLTLRQRARMLYMSSPLATSAIKTNRTNVVGIGLIPKPTVDPEALGMSNEEAIAWQKQTEREFALWANDKRYCDLTGVNSFYGMQQLALMSWLMSGDVFCLIRHVKRSRLHPYSLRAMLVEADRVGSPPGPLTGDMASTTVTLENGNVCHDGVEVDGNGQIVAYHIRNGYPYETLFKAVEYERVLAYGTKTGLPNVLHVMDSERPEQYRGVSYLAQVIEILLQMRRYTESELMASLVQSYYTAFVKTEADLATVPVPEPQEKGQPEVSDDDDEYELGPGYINYMKPGEDIVMSNPGHPYSGYRDFCEEVATQAGAALELPKEVLLKVFNSNYSASRAAIMEAWSAFRMRRDWFVRDFCEPIWEIWMSEAVALGRIKAPGFFTDPIRHQAYLGCNWVGPSQGQLDPTKEIEAEVMAIHEGLTTHTDAATRLYSSNWHSNVDQLEYENRRLAEVNAAHDVTHAQEPPREEPREVPEEETDETQE